MNFNQKIDMIICVFEKDNSSDSVEEGFREGWLCGDKGQVKHYLD